ncbi:hypothetical protein [Amphibiibacter pelophylacis]|uniref:Uncharacterized protein n=1 Tax=Amphibiibacter pelophylacis TaxID=1799477 RepID=A0ACC6P2F7_9BURK
MQTLNHTQPDDSQEFRDTASGDALGTLSPNFGKQVEIGREFMSDFRDTFLALAQ